MFKNIERNMQVVVLCGGKGTRMGDGEFPKSLFPIGNKPILWHIMCIYAHYGFNNFILCLGYQGSKIRDYFCKAKGWNIKFVDTGIDTNTGERIKKVKDYIKEEDFFVTYGDGLTDINLHKLLHFYITHRKLAVLTAVKPRSSFGILKIGGLSNIVTNFEEKPVLDHWINGGFFVFHKDIFKFIKDKDILEKDTFKRIVKDRNLVAYKHQGFWECMDTYKDNLRLNYLWAQGKAPWAVWRRK